MIFEDRTMMIINILHMDATRRQWREILSFSNTIQEHLWRRPTEMYWKDWTPRCVPAHLGIDVFIRQLPATIWNEYQEGQYEMTWVVNKEIKSIPTPRNGIMSELEHYLDIISLHFSQQQPYSGCETRMPGPRMPSFVFQGLSDLKEKTKGNKAGDTDSRRPMIVSQRSTTFMDVTFCLSVRNVKWAFPFPRFMGKHLEGPDDGCLKMGDLVDIPQEGFEVIEAILEEG